MVNDSWDLSSVSNDHESATYLFVRKLPLPQTSNTN